MQDAEDVQIADWRVYYGIRAACLSVYISLFERSRACFNQRLQLLVNISRF